MKSNVKRTTAKRIKRSRHVAFAGHRKRRDDDEADDEADGGADEGDEQRLKRSQTDIITELLERTKKRPQTDALAELVRTEADQWISQPRLQRLFDVSNVTVWRWRVNPRSGFPEPRTINNRNYYRLAEVLAWHASRHQPAQPRGRPAAA